MGLYHLLELATIANRTRELPPDPAAATALDSGVGAGLKHFRERVIPRAFSPSLVADLAAVYAAHNKNKSSESELAHGLKMAFTKHRLHLNGPMLVKLIELRTEISKPRRGSAGGPLPHTRQRLAEAFLGLTDGRSLKLSDDSELSELRDLGFGPPTGFRSSTNARGVARFVLESLLGWPTDEVEQALQRYK